jgi:hypothetical protein
MEKILRKLAETVWQEEHIGRDKSVIDTMVIAMKEARTTPYLMPAYLIKSEPIDPYWEHPREGGWEY